MKSRIATYLIALCMFTAGTAFASSPVKNNSEASEVISSLLKKELKYPKFAKEQNNTECCLLIRVIVKDNGSLKVDCVNCSFSRMKEQITEAVEEINTDALKVYAGQQFSYKINFKLI